MSKQNEPKPYRVAFALSLGWLQKHHTGVFAGAQQYAETQQWISVIDEFPEFSETHFDGVIARASSQLTEWAQQNSIPVVNVWLNSPCRDELPGIFPDCQMAGELVAQHLLDRGFCRFATLTECEDSGDKEQTGFSQHVQRAGYESINIQVSSTDLEDYSTWENIINIIPSWMDQWELPIGVFVQTDNIARLITQKIRERNWRVPEDVGIVTGLNEESICEQPKPSLTGMEIGYPKIGYRAAQLLHSLMDQKQSADNAEHILLPPQGIVVRESTDFYSVDDEIVAAALAFISANSHLNIGQDDVAEAVSMGTRTLQNRFRKHLKRPIASVIRWVRINRACRELAQSQSSIASIATRVGFSGSERLNEVFRRELGISPSDYRKQRMSPMK